jgi:hypothetical protein
MLGAFTGKISKHSNLKVFRIGISYAVDEEN